MALGSLVARVIPCWIGSGYSLGDAPYDMGDNKFILNLVAEEAENHRSFNGQWTSKTTAFSLLQNPDLFSLHRQSLDGNRRRPI